MIDLVVLGGSEEELQGPGDFQRQAFHKRPQQFGFVILRQATVAFGCIGLFEAHAVLADDVLGQLGAAEGLLPGIDLLTITHHRQVGDVGADIHNRHHLVLPLVRQLALDQFEGGEGGIGLHVHDRCLEPGRLGHGHPVFHLFLAGGGNQHFHLIRRGRGGTDNLEVQVHFLQGEGNVLVGLGFDEYFQLFFPLPGRNDDLLGDDGRGRQGHGYLTGGSTHAFPRPLDGFRRGFQIDDIAIRNDVPGQHFDGISLDAETILGITGKLDHLDGGRTYVQTDQGLGLRIEYREVELQTGLPKKVPLNIYS